MPAIRLPPIPSPSVPLMDKDGVWNRIWYDYLRALDQALRQVQTLVP